MSISRKGDLNISTPLYLRSRCRRLSENRPGRARPAGGLAGRARFTNSQVEGAQGRVRLRQSHSHHIGRRDIDEGRLASAPVESSQCDDRRHGCGVGVVVVVVRTGNEPVPETSPLPPLANRPRKPSASRTAATPSTARDRRIDCIVRCDETILKRSVGFSCPPSRHTRTLQVWTAAPSEKLRR